MEHHLLAVGVVVHKDFEVVLELLDINGHIHAHSENGYFDGLGVLLLLKKESELLVIATDVSGLEGHSDGGVGVAVDLAFHAKRKLLQEII